MRISDWSSDVCSSDLFRCAHRGRPFQSTGSRTGARSGLVAQPARAATGCACESTGCERTHPDRRAAHVSDATARSEEHTSELQSLMRISYAVFCLKKQKQTYTQHISYHSRKDT